MSYYNSFIETFNAYRLLGLSEEQTDDVINIKEGWDPQYLICDLSYEDHILGASTSRSSWYSRYSPMILITKDMIDEMTADVSIYHQFVFKNNTAIQFRITGTPGNRLNMEFQLYDYITNVPAMGSSYTLITTYEDLADDDWYVLPYVSDMTDTHDNPGWEQRDAGIAWAQSKGLAYLITESPLKGTRIDDGRFLYYFDPDTVPPTYKYYYYEYANIFNENNWANVPDWFWSGNEASVSVDYPGEDDDDPEGGYGDGEEWDDEVPPPEAPTISALGTELINIYVPDLTELQNFNQWLWSSNYDQQVKKLQASPMDNLVAFGFIPHTVTGVVENIHIGGMDTGVASKAAATQYITIDCGSVDIGKYYDSFLDYDFEFQIFLPFIGFKPLRADDITGASIQVQYLVDILTGTCNASIIITKYDEFLKQTLTNTTYSYSGNCFTELPISGANYARMKQGQMASVVHGATSIASNIFKGASAGVAGGPAGAIGGAIAGAALSLPDLMSAKQSYDLQRPEYERGGGLSGNGIFSIKKPFVIRTRMIRKVPTNYKELKGIPCERYFLMSDLQGFTKVNAVKTGDLNHATTEERAEIIRLLQEGVFI